MDEYLALKDVAKLMLVSERTVARWVTLGRLTPIRIGHTLRFARKRLLVQLEHYEYEESHPKHDPMLG